MRPLDRKTLVDQLPFQEEKGLIMIVNSRGLISVLEVGDHVVVVVSMRSGQRCIKRCKAASTAAGTSTILAK